MENKKKKLITIRWALLLCEMRKQGSQFISIEMSIVCLFCGVIAQHRHEHKHNNPCAVYVLSFRFMLCVVRGVCLAMNGCPLRTVAAQTVVSTLSSQHTPSFFVTHRQLAWKQLGTLLRTSEQTEEKQNRLIAESNRSKMLKFNSYVIKTLFGRKRLVCRSIDVSVILIWCGFHVWRRWWHWSGNDERWDERIIYANNEITNYETHSKFNRQTKYLFSFRVRLCSSPQWPPTSLRWGDLYTIFQSNIWRWSSRQLS